ncbi:lytic transglycosylase domain-containing protein [Pontibacter vulgaris]|uniref:lytic transglycosylase domain-containing protein n=1 Tax=Pontibacter vulgaris TaxID=2905679 RepID=UPI001FA7D938|nr:lytic transglycosylase domain-containing protein [Pontibacter vulgaris]
MTYTKLFTVLAAIVGSMWAFCAHANSFGPGYEKPIAEDSLKPQVEDTTLFTPEEIDLMIEYIPNEPNEVIKDRLSCIESDFPLTFNPFVRGFIDYFTIRNRKYTRTMISRENVYFPLFEKYLKKYNMPQDLKYLSIVESGLNPKAKSVAAAVGLWQFIGSTGKEYGLDQNGHIDERMDPEKATDAAMRFLSRLHRYYGDWELAMAAYNCGQGNVNKAIRRAGGGKKTFWEIFPYLPKETRSYVPSMTAVIYTMKYAPEHNIFSDSILYATDVEHLEVNQALDLEKLAVELHVDTKSLLALNPELKTKMLPAHTRNYKLRIPAQRAALLATETDRSCIMLAATPTQRIPDPVKEITPALAQPLLATAKPDTAEKKAAADKLTYIVKRGDNLTTIANRHQVTVEQLKEWNKLGKSSIIPNQKLFVFGTATEEPALLASAEEKAEPKEVKKIAKASTKKSPETAREQKESAVHHVQPGDTLWNISQRYNGISVDQIKKLNKLKSNEIKPGQKLIIS